MSWISLPDLCGVIFHCVKSPGLAGPVNAVAPDPVTNLEFTKTLGRVISRPTIFPIPAFAARLALGEMADELLLSSARVAPAKLLERKFDFKHPELEPALKSLLLS
jgi:NAD dependent epimerase/dehydratase family enzyme